MWFWRRRAVGPRVVELERLAVKNAGWSSRRGVVLEPGRVGVCGPLPASAHGPVSVSSWPDG